MFDDKNDKRGLSQDGTYQSQAQGGVDLNRRVAPKYQDSYTCHSIGEDVPYMTSPSFPLIVAPKDKAPNTGTIIDLDHETRLIDAIRAAHMAVRDLSLDASRFIAMAVSRLNGARKIISENRTSARAAIFDEFGKFSDMLAEARFSPGEPILDLPGHRNAILIAHDNLAVISPDRLDALLEQTKDPEKKDEANKELLRIAFPKLIEAKESGMPVMIFSARSLPVWIVPFIGVNNITSIVLPSEEYTQRGHFRGYFTALSIKLAAVSDSADIKQAKAEAAEIAEKIQGKYALLHQVSQDTPNGSQLVTKLISGDLTELERYQESNKIERGSLTTYDSTILNLDGNERIVSLEADSVKNLEPLTSTSSKIGIGLVKTEFLIESERQKGDPDNIYDFSEDRLKEIYEKYISVAGDRPITLRLVDESGENSQDFKQIIPPEKRQEFRDRQVRALATVINESNRKIGIMIPNFEAEDQLNRVYNFAKKAAPDAVKNGLITVVPMIESTKAIGVVRGILKEHPERISELALGIGDFTKSAAHVDSRDSEVLRDPALPVFYKLANAAQLSIDYNVPITVCGDRTLDPKILLLLETAGFYKKSDGVFRICTSVNNYTKVRQIIEKLSEELSEETYNRLWGGDDPKDVYADAIRRIYSNQG